MKMLCRSRQLPRQAEMVVSFSMRASESAGRGGNDLPVWIFADRAGFRGATHRGYIAAAFADLKEDYDFRQEWAVIGSIGDYPTIHVPLGRSEVATKIRDGNKSICPSRWKPSRMIR
jgi:hypothetical protein